jgi:DNA end-binding protein Ku
MLLETLHYQEEIRKSDSVFSEIPAKSADPDLLEVATALIDKKTAKFDPTEYKNHYQAALRELIQRKLKSKGRRIEVEEEKPRKESSNVIDLMAALKKSLESGERTPARATARKAPAKKAAAKKAAHKAAPRRKAS